MKKRILTFLLAAAALLTVQGVPALAGSTADGNPERMEAANPVHNCTKQYGGSDCTDWSYVYFGSYPQTEINENEVTESMREAYYDSNGDAWVDGVKYRRVKFGADDYISYSYYKWERIRWRVLQNDGSTLFVMADLGLDSKKYNETEEPVTWENCSLRAWLNDIFYNTAFSSGEQEAIGLQMLINDDNPEYGTEGGNNTQDKIYLLSIDEAANPVYGFCEDYKTYSASRWGQASDYASRMGASGANHNSYTGGNNNYYWGLRSPGGRTTKAADVNPYGYIDQFGSEVNNKSRAILPVLHINLNSDCWYTSDDGTSGEGGNLVSDPEPPLLALKRRLKKELRNYKNPEDYREEQKEKLAEELAYGKEAIDSAADEASAENAFESAKAVMDKIRTNAQLTLVEQEMPEGFLFRDSGDEDGIVITGYDGGAEEITIPKSAGGRNVIRIAGYAFDEDCSLKRIIIPDSITGIGKKAFYNSNIREVYYMGSEEQWEAIYDSSDDRYVRVYYNYTDDESYINEDYSYYVLEDGTVSVTGYTGDSTDIEIPETFESRPVSRIDSGRLFDDAPFQGNSSLTSIRFPSGVTSIGEEAFQGCSSLTSVILPDSVTSIGNSAFEDCTSLAGISLPSGLESIGNRAFASTALTDISIPDSVTSLGDDIFMYCTSLASVRLSSGITSIPLGSFLHCTSIKSFSFPKSVTSIGKSAFAGCSGLSEIDLSGIGSIDYAAFSDCSNLSKVSLGNRIYIGEAAFCRCISLPEIDFSRITAMGPYAFSGCTGFTNLNIPSDIRVIGKGVFSGCTNLKSVSWEPKGEYVISDYAFLGCTSLTSFHISNDSHPANDGFRYGTIGDEAFSNCKSLTDIRLPGICRIMREAFKDCTGLVSIGFSADLDEIMYAAFEGCDNLKNIYYAGTLDQWKHVKIDMGGNQIIWSATVHYGTMGPAGTGNGNGQNPGSVTDVSSDKPSGTSFSGKIKAKSKSFVVKWKKQKSVSGYQIQYSTSRKFTKKTTKTKTVKKASATSLTIKKLKAKKTYYVRVRTYRTKNGKKTVSGWSKVKRVKTKK